MDKNNCSCNNQNSCNANQSQMLDRIRKVDFALVDTILFLDAYPCSEDALAYYHKLKSGKEELVKKYEAMYGPLTSYGNDSESDWNWIRGPWPWEYDANK